MRFLNLVFVKYARKTDRGCNDFTIAAPSRRLFNAAGLMPDPSPRLFGYHEVWHACTVAAAVCHLGAVWIIVRA